ncbi:MAG: GTP 3',8-cyclase MoaA [Methanobacteriota archaeon]
MSLRDNFQRPVSNLRISLNSACNLRCVYCHREGECRPEEAMPLEDIREILLVAQRLGIRSVKFTGGEPLMRSDIVDVIRSVPEGIESSMTTNGTLLGPLAEDLRKAGLSRVNISLDSLKPEIYKKITGSDRLDDALAGIEAARKAGLVPIKINMVLLKGYNEDEIPDFIKLVTDDRQMVLQIIELMDMGDCPYHADLSNLEEIIAASSKRVITRRMHHRKKYCYDGAEIEFVRPLHNSEFCKHCNRLRITSDGRLKPCLLRHDNHIDIKGKKGEELEDLFREAIRLREPYNT